MDPLLWIYLAAWCASLAFSVTLILARSSGYVITQRAYWKILFQPWKVCTFLLAWLGITLIAPYTGDPTWDYIDATFMSFLSYLTAPWSLGVLVRFIRGDRQVARAFVALNVWMFSASWSYDLYNLWKSGNYPLTWWTNIILSSILYGAAGVLWSLDWRPNRGVTLAFLHPDWPSHDLPPAFRKIFWYALPWMLLAAGMMVPFLWRQVFG